MENEEKFCLKWSDFEKNISRAFSELKEDEDFFDVTLACDGNQLQAHKVILSACSPFFRSILKRNMHPHPLLYLKGIKYEEIQSILNFIYHGEVNVAQADLSSFLAVAEDLQVKGLSAAGQEQPSNQTEAKRTLDTQSNEIIPTNKRLPKQPKLSVGSSNETKAENIIAIVKTESIAVDVDCDPLLTPGQQNMEQDSYGYQHSYQEQMRQQLKQMGRVAATGQGWNLTETFSCHICEKSYSNKKSLQNHMTTHKGMTYCSICDKTLSSPTYLRAHMAQLHNQQQPV